MMKLIEAVGHLRLSQAASVQRDAALEDLIRYALRYEKSLRYYAAEKNYLDGVPMHDSGTGLLDMPDNGYSARLALGLEDVPLGIVVRAA